MDVCDEDDGPLCGDRLEIPEFGDDTPLLEVKRYIGIRDEAVTLAVSSEDKDKEAEHCVATVPAFSLHSGSPAAFCESRKIFLEVSHGVGEHGKDLHTDARRAAGDRCSRDACAMQTAARENRWSDEESGGNESHF